MIPFLAARFLLGGGGVARFLGRFALRQVFGAALGGNDGDDVHRAILEGVRQTVASLRVRVDNRGSLRYLNDIQRRKIPRVTAIALTRTAKELQKILEDEVRRVFNQPTPWVAKGTFVKPATKQTLTATVGFKDRQSLYVKEHVTGGRRNQKPYEKALSGLGVLPSGFKAIPGVGMRLDSHGNPNRAQLKEVFGALRTGMGQYGRRGKSTYLVGYFVIQPGNASHLPPGIWRRVNNRTIVPVLVFVPGAAYEKRLDLKAIAAEHAQTIFNREFSRAWAQYQ